MEQDRLITELQDILSRVKSVRTNMRSGHFLDADDKLRGLEQKANWLLREAIEESGLEKEDL
jgi:hypothetical protein